VDLTLPQVKDQHEEHVRGLASDEHVLVLGGRHRPGIRDRAVREVVTVEVLVRDRVEVIPEIERRRVVLADPYRMRIHCRQELSFGQAGHQGSMRPTATGYKGPV
jgi:hypothetical protein